MARAGTNHKGGRPVGALAKRTKALRAIADEALASGVHPLSIMLENMRFFHSEADALLAKVLVGLKKQEKTERLVELLASLTNSRMKAQSCAVDAAPYVHAKLSAVHVDGQVKHKHEESDAAFQLIEGTVEQVINSTAVDPWRESQVEVNSSPEPDHSGEREPEHKGRKLVYVADASRQRVG